jgi:hypothetical protein
VANALDGTSTATAAAQSSPAANRRSESKAGIGRLERNLIGSPLFPGLKACFGRERITVANLLPPTLPGDSYRRLVRSSLNQGGALATLPRDKPLRPAWGGKILASGPFAGHFGTIPGKKPVEHCFFCFFIVFWEKTMFERTNTMFGGFFYCFFPPNIV